MAENESLDLTDPGGQRWRHVLDAVRKRKTPTEVARQVELKLPKSLKKALNEFLEKGVSLKQMLANRNDPKALQKLARKCGSHEYANLFAETAAISVAKPDSRFRRQSLLVAGIDEEASTYKYDILSRHGERGQITERRLACLKAFLMQVAELEQVQSGRRLPERVLRHLMGTGIVNHGDLSAHCIRLLSEYRREWLSVAHRAEQCGYSWTKLIASSGRNPKGSNRGSA